MVGRHRDRRARCRRSHALAGGRRCHRQLPPVGPFMPADLTEPKAALCTLMAALGDLGMTVQRERADGAGAHLLMPPHPASWPSWRPTLSCAATAAGWPCRDVD